MTWWAIGAIITVLPVAWPHLATYGRYAFAVPSLYLAHEALRDAD